jgi:WD40 repeat protein
MTKVFQVRSGQLRSAIVGSLWLCAVLRAFGLDPEPPQIKPRLTVHKGLEDGVGTMILSPDGKKIAVGQRHSIKLFDTKTGNEMVCMTTDKPDDYCTPIGFRADGAAFVYSSGKKIYIWDLKTNKVDRIFEVPGMEGSAQLAADGNTMLYATTKGHDVRPVLHPQTGQATDRVRTGEQYLGVFDLKSGQATTEIKASRGFGCLAISPDGKWAATGWNWEDPKVVIYDLKAGKELRTIEAYPVTEKSPRTGVKSLAFSPDGKSLLTFGQAEPRIILWDIGTGKSDNELQPRTFGGIRAMIWHPDGKTIVVAGAGKDGKGRLGLWNRNAVQVFDDDVLGNIAIETGVQLVVSTDGKMLALTGVTGDEKSFALWDVPNPGDKAKPK